MANVAFIGLGKMGSPMAARLLQAGHTVYAFNRSRPPIDALVRQGAKSAASAAEAAANGELVLTALPTTQSVEEVYRQLAAGARRGQIYADHSTVSLALNKRCAELLAARGAQFLDAPISGGPAGAQAGALTVMGGGEKAAVDAARPGVQAVRQNNPVRRGTGAGAGRKP